jgi:3-oxoacyl-[acyl-carrier protein] reductase
VKLEKKVALITGGAGGIGLATAERFAKEGARVVLWDLGKDILSKAQDKLKDLGFEVRTDVVNVTDSSQVQKVFGAVESELGPVDVLVNNAGITRDSMLHKMGEDAFDQVIDVNLKGVFLVGREAARRMRERGGGVILNTSSVVAHQGNIGQTNYAATKAGVVSFTRTWAKELGPKGVRVNAVAPGFTGTEMVLTVPEKVLSKLREATPLRRLAEPWEIAAAFAFLASDDAAFISGHCLNVDGGLQT